MCKQNITVVDSIMGTGKTTAIIDMINSNPDKSYIFVTPYLDEVDRVRRETNSRFKQPRNFGEGKLSHLHELLSSGEDIVTTHALFLKATEETNQLIYEGDYTLILDEVLNVFQKYNDNVSGFDGKSVNQDTAKWLIETGTISVSKEDLSVKWNSIKIDDFSFSEVERLAREGCLRCLDDTLYWEFPINVFRAFSDIYVLTYLFESSMLAAYFFTNKMGYKKVSVESIGVRKYRFCPYSEQTELKAELFNLVNIYEGKYNDIGKKKNMFSVSWLLSRNKDKVKEIRNIMRMYKENLKVPSKRIMWTTSKQKDFYKKLEAEKGFKLIKPINKFNKEEKEIFRKNPKAFSCFVSCNARATNDYCERDTLLYMLNRFLDPEIKKYFSIVSYPINEDEFALSELLQWIWRSAIREGKPINIYIPSLRMRKLLYSWFGAKYVPDQDRPKTLEKTTDVKDF